MGAVYLNTDLNLRARFDLGPLTAELVDAGMDLVFSRRWHGVWEATLETGSHHHPAQAIALMLDVVDRLSEEGRRLWNACLARRFNVGYEASDDPHPWTDRRWTHATWQFSPPLLQRMGTTGASFVVTMYEKPQGAGARGRP